MKSLTVKEFFESILPKPNKDNRAVIANQLTTLQMLTLRAKYDHDLSVYQFSMLVQVGKLANRVARFNGVTPEFVNTARNLLDNTEICHDYDGQYVTIDISTILVCKLAADAAAEHAGVTGFYDKLLNFD